jgi:CreA protein
LRTAEEKNGWPAKECGFHDFNIGQFNPVIWQALSGPGRQLSTLEIHFLFFTPQGEAVKTTPLWGGSNIIGENGYTTMRKRAYGGLLLSVLLLICISSVQAEIVGAVRTKFKVLGANDQIIIEAFDDPDVQGATCYLSRAKTGGISGSVGLAEDTSDASLACRQTGPIVLPAEVASGDLDGSRVFRKSTSILFKTMQVVRFYDKKRNTLVYLTYSNRIIEGSPKNSISTITIRAW